MKSLKVLFITTSYDMLGDTNDKTGAWLETIADPYYIFKEAGAELTIASPLGGQIPLDPKSESIMVATKSTKRFLKDPEAMDFLAHSSLVEEMSANDYDVLFVAGGHGALWDIASSILVKQLIEAFNNESKPIAFISHGVAALLSVQNKNGELLVKAKELTGFSNNEEISAGLNGKVPFLLETELVALGAVFSHGLNYVSHVVKHNNLVTGQNPASSEGAAKAILVLSKEKRYSFPEITILTAN